MLTFVSVDLHNLTSGSSLFRLRNYATPRGLGNILAPSGIFKKIIFTFHGQLDESRSESGTTLRNCKFKGEDDDVMRNRFFRLHH